MPNRSETERHTRTRWNVLTQTAERHAGWMAGVLVAGLGFLCVCRSYSKYFWLDEIMGVLIARVPTLSQVWAVCSSGADNQPPAYHDLMWMSVRLFHSDAFGMRLPATAGYLVFLFCLYVFVRRLTGSRLYGLAALFYPCVTGAWYYATEGRSYGLQLGCTGLAALCWQSYRRGGGRIFLLLLSIAVTCALHLHYYSVLLIFPFACVELFPALRGRAVQLDSVTALFAPLLTLLPYVQLIRGNRLRSGIRQNHWFAPYFVKSMEEFLYAFVGPSLVALVLIGIAYVCMQWRSARVTDAAAEEARLALPAAEMALVLLFCAIPLPGVLLSVYGTHIFFPRYFITSMFGFSALLTVGLWFAFRTRGEGALLALALMAAVFYQTAKQELLWTKTGWGRSHVLTVQNSLPATAQKDDLPVAVADIFDYLPMFYYGDAKLRSRIVYPYNEAAALQWIGYTIAERMLEGSSPFFGTPVQDYQSFKAAHPAFYIYGGVKVQTWLVPQLLADHASVTVVPGGQANDERGLYDLFLRADIAADAR